jgi:N-terminal half of MaoC dehydratase
MYRVPIEYGKVREFAHAVKAKSGSHQDSDAVVPATFLTTARLTWEPSHESAISQLGFDMARVLHGEEEYEFFGPLPRAGQELQVESRIEKQFEKPGGRGGTMRFAVVVNEFKNDAGSVVALQRSTVIETEGRD